MMPEGVVMYEFDRVVEATGEVFFTGFRQGGLGAKDRQLYRVSLEGGAAKVLSPEGPGSVVAEVAPGGRAWVLTQSTASTPPRASVHRASRVGADRAALPIRRRLPARRSPQVGVPDRPRSRRRRVADSHPEAGRLRPGPPLSRRHVPLRRTAVAGRRGRRAERPTRELWHARLAQRGYVVVASDNPASAFFGKRGADRLYRRFGELELQSQLAVVDYLKKQRWVDPERIGLWGWSGGGANTLYSVLHSPGTWRAAVAGAPVTDWRLYDSIWTERYLDSPGDNPDGYRDSSSITVASKLADALLIVHGLADDNVHPQNTTMITREFIKAGKRFEQAFYPDEKHALTDTSSRHFYARMEEFFDRWLSRPALAVTPPAVRVYAFLDDFSTIRTPTARRAEHCLGVGGGWERTTPWPRRSRRRRSRSSSAGGIAFHGDASSPAPARVELLRHLDPYAEALRRLRGEPEPIVDRATADASGLFTLEAPEPGLYRVRTNAPGLAPYDYPLEPLVDSIEMRRLEPPESAGTGRRSRVLDADGKPIVSPRVTRVFDVDPRNRGKSGSSWAITAWKTGGAIEVHAARDSKATIEISAPRHEPRRVALTSLGDEPVRLARRAGAFERRLVVVDPKGAAIAEAVVVDTRPTRSPQRPLTVPRAACSRPARRFTSSSATAGPQRGKRPR